MVSALCLLLLVGAAAPVQAGNTVANTISAFTHTDAWTTNNPCPGTPGTHTTDPAGQPHTPPYGTPYTWTWTGATKKAESSASASETGASASSSAKQFVRMDSIWATITESTRVTDPAKSAGTAVYCMADPSSSGIYLHGITLLVEGGSSIRAFINITVWDNTKKERIWFAGSTAPLTAELTPTRLTLSRPWPKSWDTTNPGKASYPYGSIPVDLTGRTGNEIHYYTEAKAEVSSVGRANVQVTPRVGGIVIPVDKLALLAPYIALAVAVVAATVGALYGRKRWFGKAAIQRF